MPNKPVMVILTESLRRDNQAPLKYFDKIKIYHFYKQSPYGEMTEDDMKGAIKYSNLSDLERKIIQLKPDIIQGAEPYGSKQMFLLSLLSYRISKKLSIPLIFPFLENRPPKEKFGFIKRSIANYFLKKYVKQASLIFYLNKGAKKNLLDSGADGKKLLPFLWGIWGVDTRLFSPNKKKTMHTILFGGRLDKAKGVEYLLPAFLEVKKKVKDAKLVLIGLGELENWTRDFVKDNNLSDSVIFTGIIKNIDLPKYLEQADVFTCPSITLSWWEEQIGMMNLQAMSSGVPVVSTFSGANSEYVINNETGILVPEKDIQKLAEAFIKLLTNESLRNRMSKSARQYSLENYDDKKNVKKAEQIILNLLKQYEK